LRGHLLAIRFSLAFDFPVCGWACGSLHRLTASASGCCGVFVALELDAVAIDPRLFQKVYFV
jgi:hypothetical protein